MKIRIDISTEIIDRLKKQALEKSLSVEKYIAFVISKDLDISDEEREQIIVTIED